MQTSIHRIIYATQGIICPACPLLFLSNSATHISKHLLVVDVLESGDKGRVHGLTSLLVECDNLLRTPGNTLRGNVELGVDLVVRTR